MREKLRQRMPFVLAVFCFGVAGVDALSEGSIWLGAVNLVAVAANLVAWLLAERGPRWLEGAVLLVNVPVALVQSASYFSAGKTGLPWVWLAVALAYGLVGSYRTSKALAS